MNNQTINKTDRRTFICKSCTGILALSAFNSFSMLGNMPMDKEDDENLEKQLKKDFFTYACSGGLFLYVNRSYDREREDFALSVATLSGGIMQAGYQCGMLWGATLATGEEVNRRYNDEHKAIHKTMQISQKLANSFFLAAKSLSCQEITNTDWSKKLSIPKYLVTGKTFTCLNLAKEWAPEAVEIINTELEQKQSDADYPSTNCATEVAKRMCASEVESVMVAGFAGGYGLTGSGCGALATSVWLKSLKWFRENPDSNQMYNSYAKETLEQFRELTNDELACEKICGMKFQSIQDHAEYIENGGCSHIISLISETA